MNGALAKGSRRWSRVQINLSTIFGTGKLAAKARRRQNAFVQSIAKWWKQDCGAVELVLSAISLFTLAESVKRIGNSSTWRLMKRRAGLFATFLTDTFGEEWGCIAWQII